MALTLGDPLIPDLPNAETVSSNASPPSASPSTMQTLAPSSSPSPSPSSPSSSSPSPSSSSQNATTTVAPVTAAPLIAGVGIDETVSGQLDKLLKSGNPLLEATKARAQETANARGLQNSTLAAGAGERALIETATPIATSDAQTNFARTTQNLTAQNQFGLQEAGVQGQLRVGEQDFQSKSALLQKEADARAQLLAQEGAQRIQEINTQTDATHMLQEMQQSHELLMQSVAAGNALNLEDKQFQNQMALSVAQYGNQIGLSQLEQTQQLERMNQQHAYTLGEIQAQADASRSNFGAQLGGQYLSAVSDRMHAGSNEIASIYSTQGLSTQQQNSAVSSAYARMQADIKAIGSYYRQSPDWNGQWGTSP